MNVNAVGVYTGLINTFASSIYKAQNSDFKYMFDRITGGNSADRISENYNVTLDVGGMGNYEQLLNTYDMRCTNYVRISPETLLKMETDPDLKNKVLSEIEGFCSEKQQSEIKALQPPVKSSGMMIYPDGSSISWVEGYPNEFEGLKNRRKILSDRSVNQLFQKYKYSGNGMMMGLENIMQMMAAGYRR